MYRLRIVLLAFVTVLMWLLGSVSPALALAVPGQQLGPWTLTDIRLVPSAHADQGVATGPGPTGTITRGHGDVTAAMARSGWVHIGDPDVRRGIVVDAYQGTAAATDKLFVVTAANGRRIYLRHPLVAGESFHNSFAAISPDGRWFVAGEWGTVHRLLVFAMPAPAGSAADVHRIAPLAGVIALQRPVNDVQGCGFTTPTSLLCSSTDRTASRFPAPDPLLALRLRAPLGHAGGSAAVAYVGAIPQDPSCSVVGEAEGLDVHGNTLRIALNSPCRNGTVLETFVRDDSEQPATSSPRPGPVAAAVLEPAVTSARRDRTPLRRRSERPGRAA